MFSFLQNTEILFSIKSMIEQISLDFFNNFSIVNKAQTLFLPMLLLVFLFIYTGFVPQYQRTASKLMSFQATYKVIYSIMYLTIFGLIIFLFTIA